MYTADPQNASNFVAGVDLAFMIILGISFFFLIALTVVMLVFIYKYKKKRHPKAIQNEGSNKLEAIWTGNKTAKVAMDSAIERGNALLRRFEQANK